MKRLLALLIAASVLLFAAGCGAQSTPSASEIPDSASVSESEAGEAQPSAEETTAAAQIPEEEPETAEESSTSEEPAEPQEPDRPVIEYPAGNGETLSIFTMTPARVDSITDIISFAQASENTGVNIDWREVSFMAYTENIGLMIASEDYTDMIVAFNASGNGNALGSLVTMDDAIDQNILTDLTDYLPEYAPDYYAYLQEDPGLLNEMKSLEGRIGSFYQIYDGIVAIRGDVIRQDWLDELGLEVPQTYDQLHDVLTAFKSAYDCSFPYLMNMNACDFYQLNAGYGIPGYSCGENDLGMFVVDGKVQSTLLADGYREYIQMLADWYSEGLFSQDFTTIISGFMDGTRQQLLLTDQVGVSYVSNNGSVGYASEANDPDFALSPLPNITKAEGEQVHFIEDYSRLNTALNIFAACSNIELACNYLNYFYTEEGSLLATYGVEGIDWEYNDQGEPTFTDKVMQHETLTPNMAMQTVTMSSCWIGAYPMRIKTYFYTDQQYRNAETWMSNADSEYMLIGVTSPLSDDVTEYNSKMSDITTYADTMVLSFITGAEPMSEWDGFISTIKSLGIEDCVAAMQRAYDFRQENA